MQRRVPRRGAQEWRALVEAWKRSGQSSKNFCAVHGLVPKQLGWWAWELKRRDRAAAEGGRAAPATFWPVHVVDRSSNSGAARSAAPSTVEIVLGEHRTIRVPVGTDASWLGQMVAALQGGGAC